MLAVFLLFWPARPHTMASVTSIVKRDKWTYAISADRWKVDPISKVVLVKFPRWFLPVLDHFLSVQTISDRVFALSSH